MAAPASAHCSQSIREAVDFGSSLLPKAHEIKTARDNLRTNYLPRESTRLHVVASSAPADLAAYETHISNLESALANPTGVENDLSDTLTRIRTEHSMLSEYFHVCSSALSPIRRLPPEILVQIFDFYVPVDKGFNSEDYAAEIHRLTNRDLMQLGHVCAYWRVLVLETPAFWRALDLDLKFWSPKMLPLVQTRLERSGNSSLLMRLGAPETVAVDHSLLQMVAQHSSRWHAALFYMNFASYSALSPISGNLPLLECVHIAGIQDWDDSVHDTDLATAAVKLFADAPCLRDVTYIGPAKALKSLPWSQIQRFEYLDLHSFELTASLEVLKYFPPGMRFELRRLMYHQVVIIALDDLAQIMNPQPVVSQLTHLTVEYALHFYGAINDVLKRLTLPSLTCLEFVVWQYNDMPPLLWDQPAFHEFCVRSNSHQTLTTLYIQHVALTPEQLYATLADLDALTSLVIADHPAKQTAQCESPECILVTDEVLRKLSAGNPTGLIPNLSSFGCLSLVHFDEAVYLEFVRSYVDRRGSDFDSHIRWHPGTERELKPEVLTELAKLTQEKGFIGSIQVADEVEMYTFFY
ncbi:F-box domain-containing protein [Favolaschia claudopus]|uniref:F-box domain-containing protein n=1 Tax=Favolaschia claudopus TaxID=2862362 RepID=A0AAW0BZR7_9AGAR